MHPTKLQRELRAFWKLVNLQDCVWENHCRLIMKTILQEKETIHYSIKIWIENFPMPQAMKIPAAKAAVDKEWEKLEKISAWNLTKVRSRKEVIDEARTKVELCSEVIFKRRFRRLCSIHRTRIISFSTDSSIGHGYHLQIATLWWTSSWRSSCLYPVKNGRCSTITENSQFGVSRHLDSSTTTQMAQFMVMYGRPSRSSWAESVRSSIGRTIMGKAIWENPIETWLGENSQLGMSLCTSWKRIILICVCGWFKTGWKETQHWSDVKSTQ